MTNGDPAGQITDHKLSDETQRQQHVAPLVLVQPFAHEEGAILEHHKPAVSSVKNIQHKEASP